MASEKKAGGKAADSASRRMPKATEAEKRQIDAFLTRLITGSETLVHRIMDNRQLDGDTASQGIAAWHGQIVRVLSWAKKINQQRSVIDGKNNSRSPKRSRKHV